MSEKRKGVIFCSYRGKWKEELEGRFQGVIQSYEVDSREPRLENNPEEFQCLSPFNPCLHHIADNRNKMFWKMEKKIIAKIDYGKVVAEPEELIRISARGLAYVLRTYQMLRET